MRIENRTPRVNDNQSRRLTNGVHAARPHSNGPQMGQD
jgi:hypothetical protein